MGGAIIMGLWRIILSVIVVSAAAMCAVSWCQGMGVSAETAALVQRPSAVERWQDKKTLAIQAPSVSRGSPLVVQARIYAGLLNPPKPEPVAKAKPTAMTSSPARREVVDRTSRFRATPQRVSPTFKVHATSVFARDPGKSMALISEPGKAPYWIRPGDTLGYLEVTQIRRDAVVYALDQTTGEVAWEPAVTDVPSRPKAASPTLAMNGPSATVSPAPPPPVPASPLPSRLASPVNERMQQMSPRARRGGR